MMRRGAVGDPGLDFGGQPPDRVRAEAASRRELSALLEAVKAGIGQTGEEADLRPADYAVVHP